MESRIWASDRVFGGLFATFLLLSVVFAAVVAKAALDDGGGSRATVAAGAQGTLEGGIAPGEPLTGAAQSAGSGGTAGGNAAVTGDAASPSGAGGTSAAGGDAGAAAQSTGGSGDKPQVLSGGAIPPPPDIKVPPDQDKQGVSDSTIVVGADAHLSGAAAYPGCVDSPLAYFRMINDQGGVNGRKIKYVAYDDGTTDGARAQANVRRLNEQDKILALVGGCSPITGESIEPYITQNAIPWINDMSISLSTYKTPAAFPLFTQGATNCRWAGIYTARQKQVKKVAIFKVNSYLSQDCAKEFQIAVEKGGIQVVKEFFQPLGYPDYTSEVNQARSAGAEMIFISAETNTFQRIMQALQRQNWKPKIGATIYGYSKKKLQGPLLSVAAGTVYGLQAISPGMTQHPEVALMRQMLDKYVPGHDLDTGDTQNWMTAKFFIEALKALGKDVTRTRLMGWMAAQSGWDPQGFNLPFKMGRTDEKGFYRGGNNGQNIGVLQPDGEVRDSGTWGPGPTQLDANFSNYSL